MADGSSLRQALDSLRDALSGQEISAAIARGMAADKARAAAENFTQTLMHRLNRGQPVAEAVAHAERHFLHTPSPAAGGEKPTAPTVEALASGQGVTTAISKIAPQGDERTSKAFAAVLGSRLAQGDSLASAQKTCDAPSLLEILASGQGSDSLKDQTTNKIIGDVLARGGTLSEATERATKTQTLLAEAYLSSSAPTPNPPADAIAPTHRAREMREVPAALPAAVPALPPRSVRWMMPQPLPSAPEMRWPCAPLAELPSRRPWPSIAP